MPKVFIIAVVAAIVFASLSFLLFNQKGSIEAKYDKLQARLDVMATSEHKLKEELGEISEKIADLDSLAKSASDLQEKLDEAQSAVKRLTMEKQELMSRIDQLENVVPAGIPQ